jgi:hyperosmotically inducible protein
MRLRWGTIPVLGMLLLVGACASPFKSTADRIDDAMTSAAVKTKLAGDRLGTLTEVSVDTRQGEVTLSGTVEDEVQRERASYLAGQVRGVRSVVNNLQTRSATTTASSSPAGGTWRAPERTADGSIDDVRARAAREAASENRPVTYERRDGSQRIEASPLASPGSAGGCRWVAQRVYDNGRLIDERSSEVCS